MLKCWMLRQKGPTPLLNSAEFLYGDYIRFPISIGCFNGTNMSEWNVISGLTVRKLCSSFMPPMWPFSEGLPTIRPSPHQRTSSPPPWCEVSRRTSPHTTIIRFIYGPNLHNTWACNTVDFDYMWDTVWGFYTEHKEMGCWYYGWKDIWT